MSKWMETMMAFLVKNNGVSNQGNTNEVQWNLGNTQSTRA
jgi:hypothetical protein